MIGVKWIKDQKGNEYPIRFNMTVFYQLAKDAGIPPNKIVKFINSMSEWDVSQTYRFYQYALQSGARHEGREFDMDELAFVDWLFDDDTLLTQIVERFAESMSEGEGTGAKSKKKQPT